MDLLGRDPSWRLAGRGTCQLARTAHDHDRRRGGLCPLLALDPLLARRCLARASAPGSNTARSRRRAHSEPRGDDAASVMIAQCMCLRLWPQPEAHALAMPAAYRAELPSVGVPVSRPL